MSFVEGSCTERMQIYRGCMMDPCFISNTPVAMLEVHQGHVHYGKVKLLNGDECSSIIDMGGVHCIPNWTSCHPAYRTVRNYSVFNILSWLRATDPKLILKPTP